MNERAMCRPRMRWFFPSLLAAAMLGGSITNAASVDQVAAADESSPGGMAPAHRGFSPPAESKLPNDEFGSLVRLGREMFIHTDQLAKPYVGNALHCSDCHLDAGRKATTAPLWAAYVSCPA